MKVSAMSLRTKDEKRLLAVSRELLEQDASSMTPEQLFAGKWAKKTVANLTGRLNAASNRCARVSDEKLKHDAGELAERLLAKSEELEALWTVLEDARKQGPPGYS